MKSSDDIQYSRLPLSIFFLSAAALGYEILLIRLFSMAYWHHFAAMIISLALLGYGASGTFLALFRERLIRRFNRAYIFNSFAASFSMVVCFSIARSIPFNPLELVWDIKQVFLLFGVYFFLSVPFFFVANCIGLSFQRFPARIPRLYQSDLIGAGLGGILVIAFLFMVMPGNCLKLFAVMSMVGCAIFAIGPVHKNKGRMVPGIIVLGIAVVLLWPSEWIKPRISEYKDLSIARNVAGARLLYQDSGPLGFLSVLENSKIPFRHAPGLSLAFTGDLPDQLGIFVDGEGPMVMTRTVRDPTEHDYLDQNLSAFPFQLLDSPRVLVLGAGGGSDVLQAQFHQASAIDVVEMDPRIIDLVGSRFSDFNGSLYGAGNIRTFPEDARGFIRKKGKEYDLVQLPMMASVGGVQSISENFLLTVEAFRDYYRRLAPGGILAVSRWIRLPPRDSLKLLATLISALEESGVEDPGKRIILARNWDTMGFFVKKGVYTPEELKKAARFFESRGFDRVYDFLIQPGDVNRYHVLERPEFYEAALALLGPDSKKFIDEYKFDIRPARDDRPFFSQFFRWKSLPEIRESLDRGGAALVEWGYLLLWATVIQAFLAAFILILLPLMFFLNKRPAGPSRFRFGAYFFLLGLAFLIIEIVLIKKFILFFNHPFYASALVISIFLVSAGTGSGFVGSRYGESLKTFSRPILIVAILLILWGGLFLVSFPLLLKTFGGVHFILKVLISIGLLFPMGFLMGIPFPLGLLRLQRNSSDFIPWAWGINGVASVISAVLGALLAVHWGFSLVFVLGLSLYLVSGFVLPRLEKITH